MRSTANGTVASLRAKPPFCGSFQKSAIWDGPLLIAPMISSSAHCREPRPLANGFGQSPNGSPKLTGSPLANPYRFSPPASPIGSCCVKETGWRLRVRLDAGQVVTASLFSRSAARALDRTSRVEALRCTFEGPTRRCAVRARAGGTALPLGGCAPCVYLAIGGVPGAAGRHHERGGPRRGLHNATLSSLPA